MPDFLLDTNVVVHQLRGEPRTVEFLDHIAARGRLVCSVLSQTEVYAGMQAEEAVATGLFFKAVRLLTVTSRIAEAGGRLRREWYPSHGTGIIDGIIAASALAHGIVLVTGNTRHFPMPALALVSPPAGRKPAKVVRGGATLLD